MSRSRALAVVLCKHTMPYEKFEDSGGGVEPITHNPYELYHPESTQVAWKRLMVVTSVFFNNDFCCSCYILLATGKSPGCRSRNPYITQNSNWKPLLYTV